MANREVWRKISGVLIGLAFVSLLLFAREQSPVFEACIHNQQAADSNQPKVEGSSAFLPSLLQRWPIATRCTGIFINENEPSITALSTIVIAIFTIVLAVVTGRQAALTREAMIADKRAFVFTNALSAFWNRDEITGHYSWNFRAQWQNSGETPTKNMTMFAECEVRTSPIPIGFDFDNPTCEPGTAFIAPRSSVNGGQVPTTGRFPITRQDVADAQAGRKFIYMWGWAKYYDIFPHTPRHITRFCWQLLPVGDPFVYDPTVPSPGLGSLVFNINYQRDGNYADDENA